MFYYRSFLWQILLILLLSSAVYINTLQGDFVWDDTSDIVKNKCIKNFYNIPSFFAKSVVTEKNEVGVYYRPLFNTSLSLDYAIWKINPLGYHLTNVLLHTLISLFIFVLTKKLLKNGAALIAAILFAVHPVHTEAVAWICGRAHLHAALFMVVSLYFYISFRDDNKKNRHLFFSIIGFSLSLLSIEIAVTFPVIVLLYEVLFREQQIRLIYSLIFFVVLTLFFLIRSNVLASFTIDINTIPLIYRLLTAPVITIKYILSFILPLNLKIGYDLKPIESVLDPLFITSIMLLVSFVLLTIFYLKKNKVIAFGILWFFITIIPVINIVKQVHPMPMSLRYFYIPSIGLSIALATSIWNLLSTIHAKYKYPALAIVLILFSIITVHENKKWRNDLILFKQMVADNPDSSIAHFYLGNAYLKLNQYKEANVEYQKSLKLKTSAQILPNLWEVYNNLSSGYYKEGLIKDAIQMSKTALGYKPDYAEAHYNLGVFYSKKGLLDKAFNKYIEALKFNPDYAEAHYNLGNLYIKKGDLSEAIREYSIAVSINPDYDIARHNLSLAYFIYGDTEAAMKEYEMLKTINSKLADKLRWHFPQNF